MKNMKFHPMLFSTPMVQALLNGTKTETRRTAGLEDVQNFKCAKVDIVMQDDKLQHVTFQEHESEEVVTVKPRASVGDYIYVRETTFDTSKVPAAELFRNVGRYIYKADDAFIGCHHWTPSMFMPKPACRIWLKVTDVRLDILKAIKEQEAVQEGISEHSLELGLTGKAYRDYSKKIPRNMVIPVTDSAIRSYQTLWESINGPDSWHENPYVWRYVFEPTTQMPEGFL